MCLFFMLQASTDQTNIDIFLPFFMGLTVAMYITVLSIIVITCQVAWPTIIPIIPLAWLNFWYRVWKLSLLSLLFFFLSATDIFQFYEVLFASVITSSVKKPNRVGFMQTKKRKQKLNTQGFS